MTDQWMPADIDLADEISDRMELRAPNAAALRAIVEAIADGDGREIVADLATGVGKTYITAALIDYLAAQGCRNVLIVTPGKTIQAKTIANFTPGHSKYVPNADNQPLVVTPTSYARGQVGESLHDKSVLKVFVFNVQQLTAPTELASKKTREVDEYIGGPIYDHLRDCDDLVIIADEHHVYSSKTAVFSPAVRDLNPRALVGLTATPDKADADKVIFRYSLAAAIADGLVKIPVIAYRADGHRDELTQLADGCLLRTVKEAAVTAWAAAEGEDVVYPVLFVVCATVEDATRVADILGGPGYIGDPDAVLLITGQSSDVALAALDSVDSPGSPIRAVVSVNKLKEGWDVRNIGVVIALRALASDALTEQVLGRGLRLPYGRRVGVRMIDTVDIVAHESYKRLLEQKDALQEQVMPSVMLNPAAAADPTAGTATLGSPPANETEFEQGVFELRQPATIIGEQEFTESGELMLVVESVESIASNAAAATAVMGQTMKRRSDVPPIAFPQRYVTQNAVRFQLSEIKNSAARAAGAAFDADFTSQLTRRAIEAQRGTSGQVIVTQRAEQSVEGTQFPVPIAQVRTELEERVRLMPEVEWTTTEVKGVERVVREFLEGAGVKVQDAGEEILWSEGRTRRAVDGFADLIRSAINGRALQPSWAFRIRQVGAVPLPMPSDIGDRFDVGPFVKGRWYGGWQRSVHERAAFHAKTTEMRIAALLDDSNSIAYWLRLDQHSDPDVYINVPNRGSYFPDFIAQDASGTMWIIEGKRDNEMDSVDTLAKKDAAEEWARAVNDEDGLGKWRYLLASEKMLHQAQSWDDLILLAKPE